ncbi:MAG: tetratricopeptide repeat protein [Ignavibacteriae bacterium]|nr:tetratricopeptide repeat protein [Ignavibacteriota bacterium]
MKKNILLLLIIFVVANSYCRIAAKGNSGETAKSISRDEKKIMFLQNKLKKLEVRKIKAGKKATLLIDSTKANVLNELHTAFLNKNSGTAMNYAMQSLSLSRQIGYERGIANGYANIGLINVFYEGKIKEGLEKCNIALKKREELHDNDGVIKSLTDIASIYYQISDYIESLKNYIAALKVAEKKGDKQEIANLYQNIADVHLQSGNPESAREFYQKAKQINGQIGNRLAVSSNLGMIAHTYVNQNQYIEALQYSIDAVTVAKTSNDRCGLGKAYKNLGNTYSAMGKHSDAVKSLNQSLKNSEASGDKDCIADASLNFGRYHEGLGHHKEALPYISKGLSLAFETGAKELIKEGSKSLININSQLNISNSSNENTELLRKAVNYQKNEESQKKSSLAGMQYNSETKGNGTKSITIPKSRSNVKDGDKINYSYIFLIVGFLILLVIIAAISSKRKVTRTTETLNIYEKKQYEEMSLAIEHVEVKEEHTLDDSLNEIKFDKVTIILIDSELFTTTNKQLPPKEMIDEMNDCFKKIEELMRKFGIEKISDFGNIYTTDSGLPISDKDHAENILNAAIEIRDFMKLRRENLNEKTFEISMYINCGALVAGIIGVKKLAYDIWGASVNMAARIEQSKETSKINITDVTYGYVKDVFNCEFQDEIEVKDKGKLKLYYVVNAIPKYSQ